MSSSQFPSGARKPIRPKGLASGALDNGSTGLPIPGANEEQKKQITQFIQMLMDKLKPQHKPILNSLKELGIPTRVKSTVINGTQMDCLVIPIDELMRKEYMHMSGVDMSELQIEE